ncbi:MAG: acylneuraminate cytidylyltransferase family protein [Lachnospiraceae bacterium]|nr:acylneuraminate cytidylyltransferase family protein [Lachnospiraceae bacterium]
MKNIAIIPARSGSKGLKDKNIRDLCGMPLMAYTIRAAIKSECFDEIMVSTDSEKYAEIAREYGAKVPFLRSEATATDTASSGDMIEEVLEGYKNRGQEFDTFCLLQPTSPLRSSEDIWAAYETYRTRASFAVISVCEAEHSPLWCGHLPETNEFTNFINPDSMKRRQDGGKFYRLNGAIYIVNVNKFKRDRFYYQAGSYAYIMPQEKSVDIDTEMDFRLAELLIQKDIH